MGDLWVVGAQNAGKSSLINALKQNAGTFKATAPLTTAPLPGTTLSLTPVSGLPLMSRSRCYDTPGVPHPYQYTSRLPGAHIEHVRMSRDAMSADHIHHNTNFASCSVASQRKLAQRHGSDASTWIILTHFSRRADKFNHVCMHTQPGTAFKIMLSGPCGMWCDRAFVHRFASVTQSRAGEDVKVLLARQRAMLPRTYRLGENHTVFLGGLARIDIVKLPARTAYLTVWASDLLPLHMGKTETAGELYDKFIGDKLFPPSAGSRGDEAATAPGVTQALGELEPLQVRREGDDRLRVLCSRTLCIRCRLRVSWQESSSALYRCCTPI